MEDRKLNRRFTLVDGMILLVAIAVSFALVRYHDFYHMAMIGVVLDHSWHRSGPVGTNSITIMVGNPEWNASSHNLTGWVHWGVWSGIAGASLGPAALILHLLPPRPRLRRVFRTPGAVACASATLVLAVTPLAFFFLPGFARDFPSHLYAFQKIPALTSGSEI